MFKLAYSMKTFSGIWIDGVATFTSRELAQAWIAVMKRAHGDDFIATA